MAQWLRAAAPADDMGSILNIHIRWLTATYNSSSRQADAL